MSSSLKIQSQLYPSFLDLVHSRYSQGESQGEPSQELRSIPNWLTPLTTLEASLLSILHLLPLLWQEAPGGGISVHGPPIMLAYISHHDPGHITLAEGSHTWPLEVAMAPSLSFSMCLRWPSVFQASLSVAWEGLCNRVNVLMSHTPVQMSWYP